jgi:hypothetical protein
VQPPLNRAALRVRNELDERDASLGAAALSPGARVAQALDLSDFARRLGRVTGAPWLEVAPDDLEQKARRYPVRTGA